MKSPVSTPNKRLRKLSLVFFFLSFFFAGCNPKAQAPRVVNLAIWGNYLTKQSEQRFIEKTGIHLNIMNYSSNEELLAKIQSGASGIDVAVPSDYMVEVMIKLQLLEPLQKDKVSATHTLAKEVIGQPFDPENRYSLPYTWAVAGIAVNRDLYKDPIHSWHDFFENPKLAGKISLLDDVREVTAAVLKMQGRSVNSVSEAELKLAKETLLKIKKSVKMFTSDTVDILKNKEVVAAHSYSPDALQASAKMQGKIEFIIPAEGGTRYIDNFVIVKGAKHVDDAHKLIDFLLQKENEVEFVSISRAGPVVAGIKSLLPLDLQNNPILFPSAQVLSKLERIHDLGDQNRLYEEIWTAVKSSE
jgi:spermidine/putrescine transport system substrate-binding protein